MGKIILFVLLICAAVYATAQEAHFNNRSPEIKQLPKAGFLLDKGWKFQAGDNPAYASPTLDDSKWQFISPTLDIDDLPQLQNTPIGWLRIRIHVDSTLLNKPLAFQVEQHLASEIYVNGVLKKKYGVVSATLTEVQAYQPQYEPFGVQFTSPEQVIAVRLSFQPNLPYIGFVPPFTGFVLRIASTEGASEFIQYEMRFDRFNYMEAAIFLLLFVIHMAFFIAYPKLKANLFFALSTLFFGAGNILYVVLKSSHNVAFITYAGILDWILLWTLYGLFLFLAIHTLFSSRKGPLFWFVVTCFSLGPIALFNYKWGTLVGMMAPLLIGTAASFRIAWTAYQTGRPGVGIVVAGLGSFFVFFFLFNLMVYEVLPSPSIGETYMLKDLFYNISIVSIPIALSIYLSLQYAYTTKDLEKKLMEVQQLSEKTIVQEQEKQQILAAQNETLEKQVAERTTELKNSLESLKATQQQLIQQEKMASLGELTAGIAHEIQNPLNFVNNFSEANKELSEELIQELDSGHLAEARELARDIRENEEKVVYHGRRADAIVKGMLQHSRKSDGLKEATDINALVDEYLRLSYHGFRAKDKNFNTIIETSYDKMVENVAVVQQDMGRVLLNLLNNAFYAVGEKKKQLNGTYEPVVSVSTRREHDQIRVTVRDNGTGMCQKVAEKIFQPFFTTKPTGKGTGLGLSLSYDIIKAHGGEISVESKEGEGTELIIKLTIMPV